MQFINWLWPSPPLAVIKEEPKDKDKEKAQEVLDQDKNNDNKDTQKAQEVPVPDPDNKQNPAVHWKYATVQLMQKIRDLPAPLNNLGVFLKKYNAVVSGSFLFSCVMPTQWQAKDVDIFLDYSTYDKCCSELMQGKWRRDFDVPPVVEYSDASFYKQFSLRHAKCPDLLINLIFYKDTPTALMVQQNIDKHFDMNGCTLQWNGDNWHIADDVIWEDFVLERKMTYREKVLIDRFERQLDVQAQDRYFSINVDYIYKRMERYESRGFTITNADQVRKCCEDFLKKNKL